MCREELYRRGRTDHVYRGTIPTGREGSCVERNYTDEGGSDHVYRGTIPTREDRSCVQRNYTDGGGRDHV